MKQILANIKGWLTQDGELLNLTTDASGSGLAVAAVFIIVAAIFTRLWIGILNHGAVHCETIADIEKCKRQPYLPSMQTVLVTVSITAGLFLLSLKTVGGIAPFRGPEGPQHAAALFACIGVAGIIAQFLWPKAKHYVFAFSIGTAATFILIGFCYMIFDPSRNQNPFFMALGVVCVVAAWKFLFGPWRPQVKASVLGTFIFWIAIHLLLKESPSERGAHILATLIALIPAVIWCMLFLKEHTQRLSLVVLMFFAGMLSTAPILFYDAMVRQGVELQFFLFRIVPESFTRTSNAFVTGNLTGITGIRSTLITTLISFLIVGFIEEISKFWVLKRSGERFFSSIDDVLQLGIFVAIGFAFAENVLNPSYFLAFVRTYLITPDAPHWGAFMGNVLGRANLTNMVHILSTGVLAYFYGLSLFADPVIEEEHKAGKIHPIPLLALRILRIPESITYRREKMLIGIVSAVSLHGLFNFLVTLPDLLPGHPRTLGDLFGAAAGSPLHHIALLIIPSLFYVVGGFWILSILFYKKSSMQERGILVRTDTYVPEGKFFAQYV